jgi:hypothetical protein
VTDSHQAATSDDPWSGELAPSFEPLRQCKKYRARRILGLGHLCRTWCYR